jgi:hypothetical protein
MEVTIGTPVQADPEVRVNRNAGKLAVVRIGQHFELRRFLFYGQKFEVVYGGNTYTIVPGDELTLAETKA